ncbi:NAD(P)-binding protein [Aspergillus coremiiformis]|uniref:NAD(P)-binding protein n=1 Tax=Aspergillus coremiiformis TaxID=138285 RepID=A0A5N6Z844_9EURO|nr:NAD(P)-binding protein [Aspergillus coremiiformis]
MPSQKIFVTGATGYISRVVSEQAVQAGHSVRGLSRRPEGDELLPKLGSIPVRGTLTDFPILARESRTADMVFHLVFDHDWSQPYEQLLKLEPDALDAIARVLIGTNKPLVTTSGTLIVAPDPDGGETDETAPLLERPILPRHLAEEHALAYAARGVRVTANWLPQYVCGRETPHGFAAESIKLAARSGESAFVGDGEHYCSSVCVDDAARLYFPVAEGAGAGEVFNGTGNTDTTYRAMATAIGKTVGVPVAERLKKEIQSGMLTPGLL